MNGCFHREVEWLVADKKQRDNQRKKFENWRRETSNALAPFNRELTNIIKEAFQLCPELTELRFTLLGSNFIAMREDYMND